MLYAYTLHGTDKRSRVRRALTCAVLALLGVSTQPAQAQQEVARGAVGPIPIGFIDALQTPLSFYPGERLHLEIDGRVDASHHFWRERKCNWLGLSCRYHQRNQANWKDPEELPLQLRLIDPADQVPNTPAHADITLGGSGEASKAYDMNKRLLVLELAPEQRSWQNGRIPYRLLGRLPDVLSRNSCSPAPSEGYCSHSQYVLILRHVDVSDRLVLLAALLSEPRSVNELMSPHFINQNIRAQKECSARRDPEGCANDIAPASRASTLIYQHATRFPKRFSDNERRQLFEFALTLDEKNADARNQLTTLLIRTGDIGRAKQESEKNLAQLQAEYGQTQTPSVELVCRYGLALSNSAKVWLADRVGTQPSDVATAAKLYEDAIGEYRKYEDGNCDALTTAPAVNTPPALVAQTDPQAPPVAPADAQLAEVPARDTIRQRLVDAFVDRARVLGLLRTRSSLKLAALALQEARDEVRQLESIEGRPSLDVPFETRATQMPAQAPVSALRVFDAPGRLVGVDASAAGDAALALLERAAPNWSLWRSSDQAQVNFAPDEPCRVGGVRTLSAILEGDALDLNRATLLMSANSATGTDIGIYSLAEKRCTRLHFEAPTVAAVANTRIVVLTPEYPWALNRTRIEDTRLQLFDPQQPDDAQLDKTIATPKILHGEALAVQADAERMLAALVVKDGSTLYLLHAKLDARNAQWSVVCTLNARLPISKLAFSHDLTALLWLDSAGGVFAAQLRNGGEANPCEDFNYNLALSGLSGAQLRILPLGAQGFALFDPAAQSRAGQLRVLRVARTAPASDGSTLSSPAKWTVDTQELSVPTQQPWLLLTGASNNELTVIRGSSPAP